MEYEHTTSEESEFRSLTLAKSKFENNFLSSLDLNL